MKHILSQNRYGRSLFLFIVLFVSLFVVQSSAVEAKSCDVETITGEGCANTLGSSEKSYTCPKGFDHTLSNLGSSLVFRVSKETKKTIKENTISLCKKAIKEARTKEQRGCKESFSVDVEKTCSKNVRCRSGSTSLAGLLKAKNFYECTTRAEETIMCGCPSR